MTAVIEVTGLTKRYGVQAVVDDISFHVEAGEISGILGPNGAGKTTAVECMEGLRRRDGGRVRILGLDPLTDRHRLHQRIGVQLQESQLQEKLKVREALELYASFYPNPADWRELLERWGLAGKADIRFARLSGGQKQRLFIALALIGNPEVVFLDELTSVVRDGLRGIFEASGEFEVAGEAANGREAVDRAAALHPDVVLMDLRMPVLDGVSAIKLLAEKGIGARVLVLTTFDTDTDVVPAIEAGATGYLLKDSPPDELLRGVRAAARGEAVLSPSVATRLLGQVRQPAREPLSQRELDILGLIAQGCSNREAAGRLFISEATVKTHVLHIYAKLGVNDRAAAVATGFERGLLPRP